MMMGIVVGVKVRMMMEIVIEIRTLRVEIMTQMMKEMNLNSSFFFSRVHTL